MMSSDDSTHGSTLVRTMQRGSPLCHWACSAPPRSEGAGRRGPAERSKGEGLQWDTLLVGVCRARMCLLDMYLEAAPLGIPGVGRLGSRVVGRHTLWKVMMLVCYQVVA